MEVLGITDELTGLYNRQYFMHRLAEEVERVRRYGGALTLISLALDNYEHMVANDGRNKADTALQQMAKALASRTRTSDIRARVEGGRLMIACVGTSLAQASWLADALRGALPAVSAPVSLPMTCSFGVTEMVDGDTAGALISRADKLLAEAIEDGGDAVIC
ncbi:diguanylate cyclase (GGDEF)-like protein [Natronocella acetinitrilica]|uniref:diguanylate cyclase n=1 Tax=Natronocella acetinitrilica TaxID=414046 RepID=A0AAE3G3R7_9GAMM|nr:GGDEF domain-containing protein [Natronocella acetinitrilica]MCP1675270.1 diguanylate cyclase (GGDEF)-like protein [Natronocella acetinitrilica]